MSSMLTPLHIIFYVFAVIAVCSALAVITVRNPVRSVLSLVITFFAMAAIWMILHAEFLALILILVYVGAVMTLFLFVIMMLNVDKEKQHSGFVKYLPFGLAVVFLLTGLLFVAVGPRYFGLSVIPLPPALPADFNNIKELGSVLYTDFAYPFEIAGTMLLAAIVAAITLTYRGPRRRKIQIPAEQLNLKLLDRLELVKLKSGAGLDSKHMLSREGE